MPRCALNFEEHGVRYAGLDRSAVGSRKYFTALALSKRVGLRFSGHLAADAASDLHTMDGRPVCRTACWSCLGGAGLVIVGQTFVFGGQGMQAACPNLGRVSVMARRLSVAGREELERRREFCGWSCGFVDCLLVAAPAVPVLLLRAKHLSFSANEASRSVRLARPRTGRRRCDASIDAVCGPASDKEAPAGLGAFQPGPS
jgi:hypothetical protein